MIEGSVVAASAAVAPNPKPEPVTEEVVSTSAAEVPAELTNTARRFPMLAPAGSERVIFEQRALPTHRREVPRRSGWSSGVPWSGPSSEPALRLDGLPMPIWFCPTCT